MILLLLLLLLILKKKHLIITETELGCLLKTRLLFREGELMNINTFKGGGGEYRSRGGVFILEGGWALNRIITTLNKVSFWCHQLFLNTFLTLSFKKI